MSQLIDAEQMLGMASGMEEEFAALLENFVSEVGECVRNGECSKTLFHQFKGAAGNLGLFAFSAKSAEYEHACEKAQELPLNWQENFLKLLNDSFHEAKKLLG